MKLIRLIIFSVCVLNAVQLSAQDVYRAEIGINGGGSYYLGDANSTLFKNMNLAYSGYFRYCFNTRLAAKLEVTKPNIFNNNILAADLTGEFNFFDLEKDEYKRFSKTFSPYIFAGLGVMSYTYINVSNQTSTKLTPSIPFGIGMKVKLGKRWNLNTQWTTRLLLADDLEGVPALNDPNGLNGTNILNNDFLSTFTVGISFDFWKKVCDCKNTTVRKDSHKYKK
jgi:hypothetical protein